MPLWGWIPNLSEGRNPVPIPARALILTMGNPKVDGVPVHVLAESLNGDGCIIAVEPLDDEQIHVSINSG